DGVVGFEGFGACIGVRCIGPGECASHGGGCSLCEYRQCGEEYANCLTDGECALTVECIGHCSIDPSCGTTCAAQHTAGKTLYETLGVCLLQKCKDYCGQ